MFLYIISYPILAEEFIADLRTTIRATLSSAEQCQQENKSERYLVFEIYNKWNYSITKLLFILMTPIFA